MSQDYRHPFFVPMIAQRHEGTLREPLRIQNADADEAIVYLYDAIGGWEGISASEFRDELAAVTAPKIALRINSPGGDVFDAIAIYNMIRMHPAEVTSHVDALAASAASVIALAGDRVVMAQHSQMMIHDAWGWAAGNADRMRRVAEFLDRQSDVIAGIYAGRGETRDHWRALMKDETWFTAEEAVEAGLADEVSEVEAVENRFDLSVFKRAPQSRQRTPQQSDPEPAPAVSAESTQEMAQERLRYERTRARLAGVA